MTRPFLPVLALCACLAAGSTLAASSSADADLPSLNYDPDTGAFTEAPPPERGWQAFADLLKKATPSVNTAIPLTPAQIAEHVSSLIDSGRAKEALDIITKRQAAHDASVSPGVDVQLRYLQGRALDALGQHDQAMAVWRQMTIDYPELPEPWNALAIAYARQGQLQLAREALETNWLKLEIHPDPKYLMPDALETLKATEELARLGFVVLPYIHADPVLCKQLESAGTAAVMPLGSPIGTNKGLKTIDFLEIIIEQSKVPVIVDAGIGAPSDAAQAMELGADAVLVNTAIAASDNPALMAEAFKLATIAGRMAYEAKLADVNRQAVASSPLTAFLQ